MFGRTEGDYIMIMSPIKLKTILKAKIVILNFLITIVVLWSKITIKKTDKDHSLRIVL